MDNNEKADKLVLLSAEETAEIFGMTKMSFLNRYHRAPESLPTAIKIKGFPPKWRTKDIDEFFEKIVAQQEKQ